MVKLGFHPLLLELDAKLFALHFSEADDDSRLALPFVYKISDFVNWFVILWYLLDQKLDHAYTI